MNHRAIHSRCRTTWLAGACAALTMGAAASWAAEGESGPQNVQEGAREVGHTIGSVFRTIGHGTRDFFKAIGHGTRDAVKAVGQAASEGGRGFKSGINGEGANEAGNQPPP